MRILRGPTDGLRPALRPVDRGLLALALLLASVPGCSTIASARAVSPASSTAAASTPEQPASARSTARTPPSASESGTKTAAGNELPAVTENREQVVKTSAWSRLKNSISRTPPQSIPLPVAEPESTEQVAEQGIFPTVDGRDF